MPAAIAVTFASSDCAVTCEQVVGHSVWIVRFWMPTGYVSQALFWNKLEDNVPFIIAEPSVLLWTIRPIGSWNG